MLPADILPSAVNLPVAIVYDADRTVTNALLGQGAGDASSCFSNAAYGGIDNFRADAHLLHALVILKWSLRSNATTIARSRIPIGSSARAHWGWTGRR
jgi:hypothetical protein